MSEVDKRARVRITLTSEENFLDIYFLFRKAMEYLSSQRYQHLTGFFEEHSEVVMPNGDVIPLTEYKLT